MKFNAYIDGFNLYKGALQKRPDLKWLDLRILSQKLWEEHKLNKVYFFTSRVKEKFPGDLAPQRQHAYLRALEGVGVEVVLGKFRKDIKWQRLVSHFHIQSIKPALYDPDSLLQDSFNKSSVAALPDEIKALVWKYGEKGTDVNLSSFLMRDVLAERLTNALVVTGDSDLATPLSICRDFGARIKLVNPKGGRNSKELAEASDNFAELNLQIVKDSLLKHESYSSNGKKIIKPKLWI